MRSGPANGPAISSRFVSRSSTGSSSLAIEPRFTSAQVARSTASGGGPGSASAANYNVSNTNDVAAQNPSSGSCATPSGSDAHGACTLRSAVQAANNVNADSTITLAAGVYKLTIAPSGGDDDSTGDLNI